MAKITYDETGPNNKETGVKVTIKIPVDEHELSDFIFKVRMEHEHNIGGVMLGLDVHIARELLSKYKITE